MDGTFQRMLWNAVPDVPQGRAHEPVSLAESQQRRGSAAAELDRLNATLQRNCQVRRMRGAPAETVPHQLLTQFTSWKTCGVVPLLKRGCTRAQ